MVLRSEEDQKIRVGELDLVRSKLTQALESIKINTKWVETAAPDVEKWLEVQYGNVNEDMGEGMVSKEGEKETTELVKETLVITKTEVIVVSENEHGVDVDVAKAVDATLIVETTDATVAGEEYNAIVESNKG